MFCFYQIIPEIIREFQPVESPQDISDILDSRFTDEDGAASNLERGGVIHECSRSDKLQPYIANKWKDWTSFVIETSDWNLELICLTKTLKRTECDYNPIFLDYFAIKMRSQLGMDDEDGFENFVSEGLRRRPKITLECVLDYILTPTVALERIFKHSHEGLSSSVMVPLHN
ncbi:hypothetical protein A0H81_05720 [Grifola frondosa]|uniref:Uncharacterized protein n=1 Tax=Grifola frondosa TaxID=5627 RepID=A0A1C7MBW9_GRIFR|nr:hypothetical protein A0H81_05720 [Grifola frondosa]